MNPFAGTAAAPSLIRPDAPPYWLSKLADDVLEELAANRFYEAQELVRRAASAHHLAPDAAAAAVAREWDRIGFVTGSRRALVL